MSKIVFFDKDDILSTLLIHVFKNTEFVYNPMSGRPMKFDYLELKDNIKWQRLKPKDYTNLLKNMAKSYINHLPKK